MWAAFLAVYKEVRGVPIRIVSHRERRLEGEGMLSVIMARCERCQDTVQRVWRHRDYGETMTHGRLRWLCADCHPSMSGVVANDLSNEVLLADGGTW